MYKRQAVYTLAVEALMRDGKALQAGTSHMLGQNFARAAGIEFLDRDNERKNPHGTSWGFSTRMVGATIMAHGDDSGLVLPPNVAPVQVVIVPIFRSDDDRTAVAGAIRPLEAALRDSRRTLPDGRTEPIRFQVDWREETPGFKYNHWELRGVPFRLEVGPRDVAAEQGMLVKRIDRSKEPVPLDRLAAELPDRLDAYQREIFGRAVAFRDDNTHRIDQYDDFKRVLDEQPGFVLAPWCGDSACEKQISTDTGATIRIVPLDQSDEPGACLRDGRPSRQPALFARAY